MVHSGWMDTRPLQFEPLDRLRTRTSAKWTSFPPDVLPLPVAEMDFPLAEPIAETLIAAVRRSDTGYQFPGRVLPEAFAGFAARRWGWQVDPARVATTTDVSVAIVEVLRRVIEPGAEVIINTPVYPPFFDLVAEAGGRVKQVPLALDASGYSLDLDLLEAAFAGGAKAFLLCNPHNPLGLPHPRAQLEAVAELAVRYGGTVVSDEIHGALTYPDATFTPFLDVSDAARECGICVTAASKAWNIAGLKCALIVTASPQHAKLVQGFPDEVFWRTSLFGYLASTAAFNEAEEWLDRAIAALQQNRELLATLLADRLPAVGYRQPGASYLAWLDFRELGWGDNPAQHALDVCRVALNPGPTFGEEGRGFVRLNFACAPEVLTEAVTRLAG